MHARNFVKTRWHPGIDLDESWAYTDSYSDHPMLAVVGHPTAVNPDLRLRSVARSYDWPVLDLS